VVAAARRRCNTAATAHRPGLPPTLHATSPQRLSPGAKRAADLYTRRLRDERRVRDALDRLIPDVAGQGARQADVIIEAIFENLPAKRELFAKLEAMAKPDAILATNTSSLKLSDIATPPKDPSRPVAITL